jgi:hypothetical protein
MPYHMQVRRVISFDSGDSIEFVDFAIALVFAFLLLTVPIAVGQTDIRPPAVPGASARIPFDFWIGGSHLPAGDYALDSILDTLVIFRNARAKTQEHAFLVPTGDAVECKEYKLVFVLHNRQHYLRELWNSNGKAVLTSNIGVAMAPADTLIEVPVIQNPTCSSPSTSGPVAPKILNRSSSVQH